MIYSSPGAQSTPGLRCPRCGSRDPTTLSWDSLAMQHWFWNPGLALPELLLGISVPAEIHFCRDCQRQHPRDSFLYCPHCATSHHGPIWGGVHALGHWGGLRCPDCGESIPAIRNLLTRLVLLVTFPLWWLPTRLTARWWRRFEQQRALSHREQARRLMEANPSDPHRVIATRARWIVTLLVMAIVAFVALFTRVDPMLFIASEIAVVISGSIYNRWGKASRSGQSPSC